MLRLEAGEAFLTRASYIAKIEEVSRRTSSSSNKARVAKLLALILSNKETKYSSYLAILAIARARDERKRKAVSSRRNDTY